MRRIAAGAARVELADAERLTVLAAWLSARPAGVPRASAGRDCCLAATARDLDPCGESHCRRHGSAEMVPSAPIPHALATLRLADGGELGVVGLPLVEAYAPLWALVLPGCAAVARLEATAADVLETACGHAGVQLVDATELLREGDEGDPEQVAGLLRLLLERAAGG